MKKDDLRIIKTKKALYNALINLMKNKTFEEIKVSDICNEALVNRSTFYAHFEDKYTLLSSFINSLKDSFLNELNTNTKTSNSKEYYTEVIKIFLAHIEREKDTYLSIAMHNRDSILVDIIYDVINKDIIAKFFFGAVVSVGIYWLYNIDKYTKEEILNYLILLIPNELK